jgi:hypothetical protein
MLPNMLPEPPEPFEPPEPPEPPPSVVASPAAVVVAAEVLELAVGDEPVAEACVVLPELVVLVAPVMPVAPLAGPEVLVSAPSEPSSPFELHATTSTKAKKPEPLRTYRDMRR